MSDDPLALSNCPDYIQQSTDAGVATAVVRWDAPDVEPVGTVVNASSVPFASGAIFPLGRHDIVYTVNSTSGNSAQCTFVVEVIGELHLESAPIFLILFFSHFQPFQFSTSLSALSHCFVKKFSVNILIMDLIDGHRYYLV